MSGSGRRGGQNGQTRRNRRNQAGGQDREQKLGLEYVLAHKDDPDFWADVWQQMTERGIDRPQRRRAERDMLEDWNRRAGSFARRTDAGQKRRDEIIKMLVEEGALTPGSHVLDIGAGPGNFTLLLAQTAARVTALEPAAEMLKILRERAAAEGATNINYLPLTWQEVDLEREGLTGQFDLVFASMTPGIQDAVTLDKMMAAARGYCYYSGFAGPHYSLAQKELLELFLGEEAVSKGLGGNILYPFRYLYAKGYRPNLRFRTNEHILESTPEGAVDDLEGYLEHYLELTPPMREEIRAYVHARTVQGVFRTERKITQGMMIWRV